MSELYKKYCECSCRITTDSRAVSEGVMFLALKGENFDGNSFAMQALDAGAAYAVVSGDVFPDPEDSRLIPVPDTFAALQELAIEHRTTLKSGSLPVIGLTGTNGKTTTKELINAVLSKRYRVSSTKGNLNNDIGVPLTLLSIPQDAEIAVVEMGANHPDDIAKLVQVCMPDYGLITNVGRAHLLGFGSFEGVKAAKGELYKWLGSREGSLIFLNEDDPDLREMASHYPCHVFGYGVRSQGVEILPISVDEPYLRIRLGEDVINTQLVGSYNATNVLCAMAVGQYFGVDKNDAIAAIEAYCPTNKRSQLVKLGTNTLIVDAYNANPSSMMSAIDNFCAISAPKKIAMLGDMRELGADSVREHVKIIWKLMTESVDAYLVGEEFRLAMEQLGLQCGECSIKAWFADSNALSDFVRDNKPSDSIVLIKGSRGIMMEKVLDVLID